jgi:histidine triad (HIT) family protein
MSDCKFCLISEGMFPCHKVWEDSKFLAFLDVNPINAGHTLLIPKPHVEYIFEMNEQAYSELLAAARKLSEPIRRAAGSKRVGMAVEGFSVPHVHIHLVPVNQMNELNPNRAVPATDEELSSMVRRIRTELDATG